MTPEQIRHARALLTQPDATVSSIARLLGVSRSTIYKYIPELVGGDRQAIEHPAAAAEPTAAVLAGSVVENREPVEIKELLAAAELVITAQKGSTSQLIRRRYLDSSPSPPSTQPSPSSPAPPNGASRRSPTRDCGPCAAGRGAAATRCTAGRNGDPHRQSEVLRGQAMGHKADRFGARSTSCRLQPSARSQMTSRNRPQALDGFLPIMEGDDTLVNPANPPCKGDDLMNNSEVRTGGCLCGKIRFAVTGEPDCPQRAAAITARSSAAAR